MKRAPIPPGNVLYTPNHPEMLLAWNTITVVLGKHSEAHALFQEALTARSRAMCPKHQVGHAAVRQASARRTTQPGSMNVCPRASHLYWRSLIISTASAMSAGGSNRANFNLKVAVLEVLYFGTKMCPWTHCTRWEGRMRHVNSTQ